MMTSSEVAQVFDTILSIPGMSEVVKIDLKISRKMYCCSTMLSNVDWQPKETTRRAICLP